VPLSREETLQPVIDFIRELDKLKGVERKTRPLGLARFENSAEHSWQLAVLAMALSRYAEGPIRVERVVSLLLLHDIGEIDTGDTIAYATEGMEQRKIAERDAVKRICAILPGELSDEFESLWHEFEAAETPEAKFAHAMDRSIPIISQSREQRAELARKRDPLRAGDQAQRSCCADGMPSALDVPRAAAR
jgi:putative hydrolases of HD superfamily